MLERSWANAMSVDTVLSRLERVRRTGKDRWVARCPAHKDRTASLSLRELDDGRVLCHCFAGCEVGAVLGAVGLDLADLYPPRDGAGAGRPSERRPFSVRDLIRALQSELSVVLVLLADMAAGRVASEADRRRAIKARDRCAALIEELGHVRLRIPRDPGHRSAVMADSIPP